MKPFLLISTRFEEPAALSEHRAVLKLAGLSSDELEWIRAESTSAADLRATDYTGILIGGSPFNSSTPDTDKSEDQIRVEQELGDLMREALEQEIPVFAMCYGVGLLSLTFKGLVDETHSETPGAVTIRVNEEGKRDPLLRDLPEEFLAFVGHKEACARLPEGAVNLASSPTCPVQMFRIGQTMYATQFHPELTREGIIERVRIYRHEGYFDPDELESLIASWDNIVVDKPAQVLRNFVAFARARAITSA